MRAAARPAVLALIAAPPAASLSRSRCCFFGPGSAELSPRRQAVLRGFAGRWGRVRRGDEGRGWPDGTPAPVRTVQVGAEGRADAAGAAVGKAPGGRARAEAVAAFSRLNGAPAGVIKAAAIGADRPLVPATGAEPQNRRAQLITK